MSDEEEDYEAEDSEVLYVLGEIYTILNVHDLNSKQVFEIGATLLINEACSCKLGKEAFKTELQNILQIYYEDMESENE